MRQGERLLIRLLIWVLVVPGVMLMASWVADGIGWASSASGEATIYSPRLIGGASGYKNERDADLYPAVAYDPSTGRYLAVWLSARNAGSSSDGFDVYGVFLDRNGYPVGNEFRISDYNTTARNGEPTVIAGNGEFAVAWTARESTCRIYVQRVTDALYRGDRLLVSGIGHYHSPKLVYNPRRHRYTLAYVAGDDYMPPTFFGADTDDCGNNASSNSGIRTVEFYFSGSFPVTGTMLDLTDVSGGAFRPHLAYSSALNQYLVAWEDRRDTGGQAYRFDIYAQRLSGNMTITGGDVALATGRDYTNYDGSATWTPRPAVAGGGDHFLATWFSREVEDSAVIWSVKGNLVSSEGMLGTVFPVAQMPFAQSHAGEAPTGFLSTAYAGTTREYLVGMTSHLESVWGYFSFALIQRVNSEGQLLQMDGSPQSAPGVGHSVDYENDDQIAIAVAVNPVSGASTADYVAVYAKHRADQTAQNLDIWSVRVQMPASYVQSVYLPHVSR